MGRDGGKRGVRNPASPKKWKEKTPKKKIPKTIKNKKYLTKLDENRTHEKKNPHRALLYLYARKPCVVTNH